jgi:hypothetical protein
VLTDPWATIMEEEIIANVVINHLNAKDSGRAGGGRDTRPSSPLLPVFSRLSPLSQLTPAISSCLTESAESLVNCVSTETEG